MAIDTANKRFSMMNLGTQPIFPLFEPSGAITDGNKYHFLTLYDGIALDAPVVGPAPTPNAAQREPVAGGTGWSAQRKKKLRIIREDDEDFLKLVQEAIPAILKYLKL